MNKTQLEAMRKFFAEEKRFCITLTEEMLGMSASDPKIHETYIASKAPDAMSTAEEVEAIGVDETVAKGRTIFPKDDQGRPFMWDYQIKGFLKEAFKSIRATGDKKKFKAAGLAAYKTKVDKNIFVYPRKIYFDMIGEMGDCQRPLRAETMQGPRVAIADSETVPAGTQMTFNIGTMIPGTMAMIEECMDYGMLSGMGAWRNSGKGTFEYEELTLEDEA